MIDVVRSVNTIRLRRYGWNTSTEGSLRRKKEKKKKNKVEEFQLANLASLGSLASNGFENASNDVTSNIKITSLLMTS